ncbi:hypothetical protein BASA61_001003 [Batrachochytrium salamandrivorans]|nr:hypothetical protein BASA62_007747 [Batrachochytrium salamandrivorans]KAH6602546.1 hypothetical protein BASA61_001003 [Batrachochytrium salamandrivorans]KAH9275142.1 hypothetical protein BASA83_002366 [Batrachochytrium salamandrivorans]
MVQMHLLEHPFHVRRHDVDKNSMDLSLEHRSSMRRKLYGPHMARANIPNSSCCEYGNFHTNYADEIPPEWQGTTHAEYTPKLSKETLANQIQNKESMKYTRASHFSLESNECPKLAISLTKKDYSAKNHNNFSKVNYKEIDQNHKGYPPIFRDENELIMSRENIIHKKIDNDTPASRFEGQPIRKVGKDSKSTAHFSFGSEPIIWESVTGTSMKAHRLTEKPKITEYELLEKSKSSVLENPDIQIDKNESVQRRDFVLSETLDRSTLKFDNTESIKNLKSTNFTLGPDNHFNPGSQYQHSFEANTLKVAEMARVHVPTVTPPSTSKFCIIVEDCEDRRIGESIQKQDYTSSSINIDTIFNIKHNVDNVKNINSKSSISFENDTSRPSNFTQSVSSAAYGHPESRRDGRFAKDAYVRGGRLQLPVYQSYHPINTSDLKTETQSVSHSEFQAPTREKILESLAPQDHCAYLKASHFEIGTQDSGVSVNDRSYSTASCHYSDPRHKPNSLRKDGAGASGLNRGSMISRRNEDFNETMLNTVTRYPHVPESLTTITNSRYGMFDHPTTRIPLRHPIVHDTMESCIHSSVFPVPSSKGSTEVVFKPIRELSTVTRRTYVAPEVMTFRSSHLP